MYMGEYLNPGNRKYIVATQSEIYIDKSEMIYELNSIVNTEQRFVCVSRPRRFGKSMAANMICAYYDREANSRQIFEQRKLSHCHPYLMGEREITWDVYLGKFDVIQFSMTNFIRENLSVSESLSLLAQRILAELSEKYPTINYDKQDLGYSLGAFYRKTGIQFVFIIDEWDAIFREKKDDKDGQKLYLDFLRDLLKDRIYIALAYMTGILPIKKYGKHSALNMFSENSMLFPSRFAPYVGFTSDEVERECDRRHLHYNEFKSWYDGYRLTNKPDDEMLKGEGIDLKKYKEYEVYCPYSVVSAMLEKTFMCFWNQTETFEALKQYIEWDFDGLREYVAILMEGKPVDVNVSNYQNDMTTFSSKDDILTMLIHLGYLGYNRKQKQAFIPNKEVREVFSASTESRSWSSTFTALRNSEALLLATWNCDKDKVAELIEKAHDKAGNRSYNSEAALSYAIQLAYYSAQDLYTLIPEMDTGKGYADLVYIPKKPNIPALIIELKFGKTEQIAFDQILERNYADRLSLYKGNLILVGINYDKTISNGSTNYKHHSCMIEKW